MDLRARNYGALFSCFHFSSAGSKAVGVFVISLSGEGCDCSLTLLVGEQKPLTSTSFKMQDGGNDYQVP